MRFALPLLIIAFLAGCSREARQLGPALPQTPPVANDDPRIPAYQDNVYQIAQGGRYFAWYGCSRCHGDNSPEPLNLSNRQWRHGAGFAQVYRSIVSIHAGHDYERRIPSEQLWQITAYVGDLPTHVPEKRRRLLVDQKAEAQGDNWSGPQ